jgi:pSer/pThr/pTyr-binding forkhead associated (FHA) protein
MRKSEDSLAEVEQIGQDRKNKKGQGSPGRGELMSEEYDLFLDACGASGPLRIQWENWETREPVHRLFDRPAVLIGRNPNADLVLDHPRVGLRHAYFQLVEGRLFGIDLDSRDGLRWDGVPRLGGWIDRRRPVQLGPTTIRILAGDQTMDERSGPGPLSHRYESLRPLPRVVLDIRDPERKTWRFPLDRVITLVGGSERCPVRLTESGTSRLVCALVRTPIGVWMVDLLPSRGAKVNGVVRRDARLEDGDVLRVGTQSIRLVYGELASPSRPQTTTASIGRVPGSGSDQSGVSSLPPALIEPHAELLTEAVLGPLLGEGEPGPEIASSPFGQALLMLIRLLGDMHRDHLKLVREEIEQIRRLNREMSAERAQLAPPEPGDRDPATSLDGVMPNLGHRENGAGRPGTEEAPNEHVVDPHVIQSLVGERLAVWERERQSCWRRVIQLLVKP